jgi:UDP-4-amino-4,6-dideoxy-N-acetyl-beta-L-altrosamine N-acetyltransferase
MQGKLEPLQEQDLDMVRAWRNHESVRHYMYTDHVISEEEHRQWFAKISQDDTVRHFVFELAHEKVGYINIVQINKSFKRAYCGGYLNPFIKTHPATTLLMEFEMLEYAFNVLKLHKLCSEVLSNNPKVLNMHKKLGFKVEGCLKQHVIKDDQYLDVWLFGLFAEDWFSVYREKLQRLTQYAELNFNNLLII